MWVPLTPGAHTVRLAGRLAPAESIQLAFPQPPRAIDVSASRLDGERRRTKAGWFPARWSWRASAARSGWQPAIRSRPAASSRRSCASTACSISISTGRCRHVVTRIAPLRAAVSVEIPLVEGESVLTPGVEVRDGDARAGRSRHGRSEHAVAVGPGARGDAGGLAAGGRRAHRGVELRRESAMARGVRRLPAGAARRCERASTGCSASFRAPARSSSLHVTRPKGVEGTTLAIDSVQHVDRGRQTLVDQPTLQFEYRSTQGGRHIIKLPRGRARDRGELRRPAACRCGRRRASCRCACRRASTTCRSTGTNRDDVQFRTRPSPVDLRIAGQQHHAVASRCRESRWPLFATGPGSGSGGAVLGRARRCSSRWRGCSGAGNVAVDVSSSGCCSVSGSRRSRGGCSRSPPRG